jgi:uncharacterized protein (TIGR00255 family)
MTGFGQAQSELRGGQLLVEIRSVNHRFLDINCKLPAPYARFEADISRMLRAALKRGRVDVFLTRIEALSNAQAPQFREDVFRSYLEIARQAVKIAGLSEKTALAHMMPGLLFRREVLDVQSPEVVAADEDWPQIEAVVRLALEKLLEMRAVEGLNLEKELSAQLDQLQDLARQIEELAGKTPAQFQERLKARLERFNPEVEIDPSRLAQEIAILADRIDITEEIVRLHSHLEQFRKTMSEGEGGRKLEFLLQEIGREINTSGSKAQNSEITTCVVTAKSVVEKIREQVLNVE